MSAVFEDTSEGGVRGNDCGKCSRKPPREVFEEAIDGSTEETAEWIIYLSTRFNSKLFRRRCEAARRTIVDCYISLQQTSSIL
jgi:hypothetical protein